MYVYVLLFSFCLLLLFCYLVIGLLMEKGKGRRMKGRKSVFLFLFEDVVARGTTVVEDDGSDGR